MKDERMSESGSADPEATAIEWIGITQEKASTASKVEASIVSRAFLKSPRPMFWCIEALTI